MKYIVEFEDEPCMYEDEAKYYKCIQAPWWGLSEKVIKQLTPYHPEPDCVSRKTALDAFGLSEKTRKYGGDHSGYDTRMLYEIQDTLESLPAVQTDHVADIGKKVCVDAISRQTAIDVLHGYFDGMLETDTWSPCDVYGLIKLLPSVQPEPKWTSCRKKLPEKEGFYLVQALMNGGIFVARWEGCYWGVKTPVVAWMPLPEPYRGGDTE